MYEDSFACTKKKHYAFITEIYEEMPSNFKAAYIRILIGNKLIYSPQKRQETEQSPCNER